MELYSQIKGSDDIPGNRALLKSLGLEGRETHRPSELSESQRRKLALAVALCGNSKFLVLDSPFCGMDLTSKRKIWKLLKQMKTGRTILITAQNIDDVDAIADRVCFMDYGSFVCTGSPGFLRSKYNFHYKFICEVSKMDSQRMLGSLIAEMTYFVTKQLPGAVFEKHVNGGISDLLHFRIPEVEHKEVFLEFLATFDQKFTKWYNLYLNVYLNGRQIFLI